MGKLRLLYRLRDSQKISSETFQNGVIVFLDALGVKGIWARAEPKSVIQAWGEVISSFHAAIEASPRTLGEGKDNEVIDYYMSAFSDTIIIALPCNDDPASLIPLMAETISKPFTDALTKGIFFRGVISIGRIYQSDNLLIGPAIDEAAEWYNQPDWIGVSTTPSASFGLYRVEEQGGPISALVKYDIPFKGGVPEPGWAVAWPHEVGVGPLAGNGERLTPRGLLLNTFAQRPIAVNATSKYRNTLKFFDYFNKTKTQPP